MHLLSERIENNIFLRTCPRASPECDGECHSPLHRLDLGEACVSPVSINLEQQLFQVLHLGLPLVAHSIVNFQGMRYLLK